MCTSHALDGCEIYAYFPQIPLATCNKNCQAFKP